MTRRVMPCAAISVMTPIRTASAPNALDEVGHRSGEGYTQAAFDVLFIFSALGLDKVGQDRGDDPAISLSLLFASECLTQQRERPVIVLIRTSDEPEAA